MLRRGGERALTGPHEKLGNVVVRPDTRTACVLMGQYLCYSHHASCRLDQGKGCTPGQHASSRVMNSTHIMACARGSPGDSRPPPPARKACIWDHLQGQSESRTPRFGNEVRGEDGWCSQVGLIQQRSVCRFLGTASVMTHAAQSRMSSRASPSTCSPCHASVGRARLHGVQPTRCCAHARAMCTRSQAASCVHRGRSQAWRRSRQGHGFPSFI